MIGACLVSAYLVMSAEDGHRALTGRGPEKAARSGAWRAPRSRPPSPRSPASWSRKGHDPVFVSRQLGHANAAITMKVYVHLFDAARHAAEARAQFEVIHGGLLARG